MTTADPVPGWYPDPGGQANAVRWWDGSQWHHQTHPMPAVTAAGAMGAGYGQPQPGFAQQPGFGQPAGYGPPPAYNPPLSDHERRMRGYGAQPYPGAGMPGQQSRYASTPALRARRRMGPVGGSFASRNSNSLITLVVGAIYVAIALSTHFFLIGIVPLLSAMRAMQRRETLAPLAIIAAIVVIVVAVVSLQGHHI